MIEYRNSVIVIARKLGLFILVVSCVGCSSIHIESTGESSPNIGTSDDSAVQASQMQSNWLSYFRSLPPERKGHAMRRMVDSASASFLDYGLDLVNEWNGIQGDQERTIGGVEFQRIMQLSEQQKNPFIRAPTRMCRTSPG